MDCVSNTGSKIADRLKKDIFQIQGNKRKFQNKNIVKAQRINLPQLSILGLHYKSFQSYNFLNKPFSVWVCIEIIRIHEFPQYEHHEKWGTV